MNIAIIDGQVFKLVETDKPEFVLQSVIEDTQAQLIKAATDTFTGSVPIVGVSMPVAKPCAVINGKKYGYFPAILNKDEFNVDKLKEKIAEWKAIAKSRMVRPMTNADMAINNSMNEGAIVAFERIEEYLK